MTYEFADDRLVNMLEYYTETNPETDLNDLVEFIRKNTANLKEELYLMKSLLNDMKYFKLEYLKDFHSLDIETKTNNLNQLSGMYYKQESLDKFLASNKTEIEKLDLRYDFFVKLYTDNIDYLEIEIESIKLTIESSDYPFGSEQEATPETATQPKEVQDETKISQLSELKKNQDKILETKKMIFDLQLETLATGSEQEATPERAKRKKKRKYKTDKIKADIQKRLNLLKTAMYRKKDGHNLCNLPQKEYMQYWRACNKMFPDIQLNDLTLDIVIKEIEKNK